MEEFPHNRLVRFGVFEADPRTRELRKQGRRVPLQGQPFDILTMLLERPGQLVSRTEIRERLWPEGTFVDFDHSLNTAVNKIRDVLGDSAASPRFIETLARRGYRFIAPVQVAGEDAGSKPAEPAPQDSPAPATVETTGRNPSLLQKFLSASHDLPPASRRLVRILFLLLQVMYFSFYLISLARLHDVQEVMVATFARPSWILVLLIITAVVGIPTRLFLMTAAGFNAPGLREKFLRLFPVIFPLDELWALAPFLLLEQIGYGLALGFTAILLYAPFAQRSLVLMGAGRSSRVEAAGS